MRDIRLRAHRASDRNVSSKRRQTATFCPTPKSDVYLEEVELFEHESAAIHISSTIRGVSISSTIRGVRGGGREREEVELVQQERAAVRKRAPGDEEDFMWKHL